MSTPLAELLREANDDERERIAQLAGTSVGYLYILAGCHRPNPSARLAFAIEDSTTTVHQETGGRLPVVTARQIATMCDAACFKEAA